MKEEWKDKIARKLNIDLDFPGDNFTKIRKFVDEVIEECRPKVTEKFVEKWAKRWKNVDCYYEVAVREMLKAAGVEVKE